VAINVEKTYVPSALSSAIILGLILFVAQRAYLPVPSHSALPAQYIPSPGCRPLNQHLTSIELRPKTLHTRP
jgi:hypothetical protein